MRQPRIAIVDTLDIVEKSICWIVKFALWIHKHYVFGGKQIFLSLEEFGHPPTRSN